MTPAASQPSSPTPLRYASPPGGNRQVGNTRRRCCVFGMPRTAGPGSHGRGERRRSERDWQRVCFVASHRDADNIHVVGVEGATSLSSESPANQVGDRGSASRGKADSKTAGGVVLLSTRRTVSAMSPVKLNRTSLE
jgi:hypothetical protein